MISISKIFLPKSAPPHGPNKSFYVHIYGPECFISLYYVLCTYFVKSTTAFIIPVQRPLSKYRSNNFFRDYRQLFLSISAYQRKLCFYT